MKIVEQIADLSAQVNNYKFFSFLSKLGYWKVKYKSFDKTDKNGLCVYGKKEI